MLAWLTENFHPELEQSSTKSSPSPSADRLSSSSRLSLAICDGEGGARLTHSHAEQYHFVLQVCVSFIVNCTVLVSLPFKSC